MPWALTLGDKPASPDILTGLRMLGLPEGPPLPVLSHHLQRAWGGGDPSSRECNWRSKLEGSKEASIQESSWKIPPGFSSAIFLATRK